PVEAISGATNGSNDNGFSPSAPVEADPGSDDEAKMTWTAPNTSNGHGKIAIPVGAKPGEGNGRATEPAVDRTASLPALAKALDSSGRMVTPASDASRAAAGADSTASAGARNGAEMAWAFADLVK